jgi:hypothetical protein
VKELAEPILIAGAEAVAEEQSSEGVPIAALHILRQAA